MTDKPVLWPGVPHNIPPFPYQPPHIPTTVAYSIGEALAKKRCKHCGKANPCG